MCAGLVELRTIPQVDPITMEITVDYNARSIDRVTGGILRFCMPDSDMLGKRQ
jgi:hypothetical protein